MKRLKTLGNIIRDAREHSKTLVAYFIANTLLAAVFSIATLYTPRILIAELLDRRRPEQILIVSAVFLAVAGVSGFFLATMKTEYIITLKTFRASLLRKQQRKDLTRSFAELEDPERQNDAWIAQKAVNNFTTGVEGICSRIFILGAALATFALYVWVIFALNILIGLFIIVGSVLLFFYSVKQNKVILEEEKKKAPIERKVWYMSNITQDYEYGKDIRIFGLKSWLLSRFETIHKLFYKHESVIAKARWRMDAADVLFAFLRGGLVFGYLIFAILKAKMSIADFTLYFTAVTLFSSVLKQLLDGVAYIGVQLELTDNFYEFIARPDEHDLSGRLPVPKEAGPDIEFRHVRFRYPSTQSDILLDLNLKIYAGEKLAVVGVNGAGKTTLVKLLCRLYAPDEGEILLGGVNIHEYDLYQWRDFMSVISQDINLMAATLAENVAFDDEYDEAKVETALRRAGFGEKLDSFENGIHTQILKVIHDDGVELSGGEKQKIAIARALYRDGRILVMDEPTAALDAVAELELYKGFAEMTSNKTTIFISHRLGSTRFCDKILLLDGAGKTQYGTHEELMASEGVYRHMFEMQSKYYGEESTP